jgi:hypothetical protein
LNRLIVAFLCLSTAPALAQDTESSDTTNVRYQDVTHIEFGDVDVNAELLRPAGARVGDRRRAEFKSLIRLRRNFDAEMASSIDAVK